jgi:hypothetical protein
MKYSLRILYTERDESFMQALNLLNENGYEVVHSEQFDCYYVIVDDTRPLGSFFDICSKYNIGIF